MAEIITLFLALWCIIAWTDGPKYVEIRSDSMNEPLEFEKIVHPLKRKRKPEAVWTR